MKIDLGHGIYLEPDEPPRDSEHHKWIIGIIRIPKSRLAGNFLDLECGHRVMYFGDLAGTGGRVLCTECRGAA